MTSEKEGLSTAESLRKTRTYGKFRCHNPTCMDDMWNGISGPLGHSNPAAYQRSGMGDEQKTGRSKIKRNGGNIICR